MKEYDKGDVVVCAVEFTAGGGFVDPGALSFKVRKPDGTVTTYVYGVDAQLVRESQGVYEVDVVADEEGTWQYRFEGTGASQSASEGEFYVKRTAFP